MRTNEQIRADRLEAKRKFLERKQNRKVTFKTYKYRGHFGWSIETIIFYNEKAVFEINTLKHYDGLCGSSLRAITSYRESERGTVTGIGKIIESFDYPEIKRWTKKKCLEKHNEALEQWKDR